MIYLAIGILIISFLTIGWLSNNLYNELINKRIYNGLRFVENNSHPLAIQTAQSYDSKGDWVCVNVRGMDYKTAIVTIQHEVGHEIFANECGKNITKCLEVVGK
jgi:Zn-dependent M32 family carboxypeptidase